MALDPDQPLYLPTDGGLAATHPEPPAQSGFVGPTTEKQDNTFRARLIPFACWKVDNIRFDYDSSFVKPEISRELNSLKQLRARHPGAVLSIFGHTEPPDPGQPPAPSRPTRYKLHIRPTDQVYPVRLAEVCCDNANRYKELERVEENYPFFKPTGQWRLKAGDDIYLPLDWQEVPGWGKLCEKFQVDPVDDGASETQGRDEEYCKAISGRRAAAIYALLARRTDIWEDIYSNSGKYTTKVSGDKWSAPVLQTMLATLGREEATTPYEQSAPRRRELFQAYMNNLCGSSSKQFKLVIQPTDSIWPVKLAKICTGQETRYKELEPHNEHLMTGPGQWRALLRPGDEIVLPPTWTREQRQRARDEHFTIEPPESDSNEATDGLELTKEDFLARGKDPHGRGDYQGCGAFNPVSLSGVGGMPVRNRRVVVLLYRSGNRVDSSQWPCPSVKEGSDKCRRRLWSDAELRLRKGPGDKLPGNESEEETFTCRFYDRSARNSPCDKVERTLQIRLYDPDGRIIRNAPFLLQVGTCAPVSGTATERGIVFVRHFEVPDSCVVRWGFKPQTGEKVQLIFSLKMFLAHENLTREDEARQKLHNLGYPDGHPLTENVAAFQRDYGHLTKPALIANGSLEDNDRTLNLLRSIYKECADDLRDTRADT